MLQKSIRHESAKLRESARGRECQIRLPGICNHDPATTVLCHLNGAGTGRKGSDILASFGCSSCHDEVDGRTRRADHLEVKLAHYDGVARTIQIWLDEGLVMLK